MVQWVVLLASFPSVGIQARKAFIYRLCRCSLDFDEISCTYHAAILANVYHRRCPE